MTARSSRVTSRTPDVLLRALLGAVIGGLLGGAPLASQEPPLRTVAELLEDATSGSGQAELQADRRCAALFRVVRDLRQRRGQTETAQMYGRWSLGFEAAALGRSMGSSAPSAQAVRDNEAEIDDLTAILAERARALFSLGDDRLMSSDFRTCRDRVDVLGL